MAHKHRIKIRLLTERELQKQTACECGNIQPLAEMGIYVDESNIAITNNSIPLCKKCYHEKYKYK